MIEPLAARHRVGEFRCGKAPLDEYLARFAGTSAAGGSARTFVKSDGDRVLGFYSLSMGAVAFDAAADRMRKGQARHDVPVVLMARFAVDSAAQGRGIGRELFLDALVRSSAAADIVAARAFFTVAKDQDARNFYSRFGMEPLPGDPLSLFLLMKDVRATLRACGLT